MERKRNIESVETGSVDSGANERSKDEPMPKTARAQESRQGEEQVKNSGLGDSGEKKEKTTEKETSGSVVLEFERHRAVDVSVKTDKILPTNGSQTSSSSAMSQPQEAFPMQPARCECERLAHFKNMAELQTKRAEELAKENRILARENRKFKDGFAKIQRDLEEFQRIMDEPLEVDIHAILREHARESHSDATEEEDPVVI